MQNCTHCLETQGQISIANTSKTLISPPSVRIICSVIAIKRLELIRKGSKEMLILLQFLFGSLILPGFG